MAGSGPGNGSGRFDVGAHDMGGWVRVLAGSTANPESEDFALALSDRLTLFFAEHPHLMLASVAAINRGGATVELHAWYEVEGSV